MPFQCAALLVFIAATFSWTFIAATFPWTFIVAALTESPIPWTFTTAAICWTFVTAIKIKSPPENHGVETGPHQNRWISWNTQTSFNIWEQSAIFRINHDNHQRQHHHTKVSGKITHKSLYSRKK